MTFRKQPVNTNTAIDFTDDPGLTEQSHAESVNIHTIMRKYEKTGIVEHVNEHKGTYASYAGTPDYYDAQLIIAQAKSMFETVPSHIRKDFDNDPAKFVDFMSDDNNYSAIAEYGLDNSHLTPPPAPEPITAPEATMEPPAE